MGKQGRSDRRVMRTKQMLREALLSLVRERGFEELSVQDILDRANVGRATFYAHFKNKEDLLFSGFEELRESLQKLQREALSRRADADVRLFAFSGAIFDHTNQFRDVFRLMSGRRSGAIVQQTLRKILVSLIREELSMLQRSRSESRSERMEASVSFLADGLSGMLLWWLSGKQRMSVDEVNGLFRALAIPSAKAALEL